MVKFAIQDNNLTHLCVSGDAAPRRKMKDQSQISRKPMNHNTYDENQSGGADRAHHGGKNNGHLVMTPYLACIMDDTGDHVGTRRFKHLSYGEAAYFGTALLYCALIVLQDFVHLQDYAQWVYSGFILNAKWHGAALPAYIIKSYPVPNSFVTVFIAAVGMIGDVVFASRILIALYIVVFAGLILAINRRTAPEQYLAISFVMLLTIVISSSFWNGYLNYQIGLMFFALHYYLELRRMNSPFTECALSIAVFFSHAAVFAVFFLYAAYRHISEKRIDLRLAALLPSAVLTLWFLYGHFALDSDMATVALASPIKGGLVTLVQYKAYTFLKTGPFQNFILADGRSFLEGYTGLYYAMIAIGAVFMMLLFLNILANACRQFRLKESRDRTLLFFAVVFASYVFFPPKMLQVVNIGERFMIVGWMFLLFRTTFHRRLITALAVVSVLFAAYNFAFLASGQRAGSQGNDTVASPAIDDGRLSENFRSLYANTSQKYFNHRVYQGVDQYRAIHDGDFTRGVFPTGMIVYHRAPHP